MMSGEQQHKKILVCGGRSFTNVELIGQTLDKLMDSYVIECVIEGDAPGADRIAGTWARTHSIPNYKFPADWKKHGKAAGPKRNTQMILNAQPDLVVAFPGSKGTADMISKAKSAGIEVLQISDGQDDDKL